MHIGVKYLDRNNPQRSSVVEGKGVLTDFVCPADYVQYSHDTWVERPLMAGIWVDRSLLPY